VLWCLVCILEMDVWLASFWLTSSLFFLYPCFSLWHLIISRLRVAGAHHHHQNNKKNVKVGIDEEESGYATWTSGVEVKTEKLNHNKRPEMHSSTEEVSLETLPTEEDVLLNSSGRSAAQRRRRHLKRRGQRTPFHRLSPSSSMGSLNLCCSRQRPWSFHAAREWNDSWDYYQPPSFIHPSPYKSKSSLKLLFYSFHANWPPLSHGFLGHPFYSLVLTTTASLSLLLLLNRLKELDRDKNNSHLFYMKRQRERLVPQALEIAMMMIPFDVLLIWFSREWLSWQVVCLVLVIKWTTNTDPFDLV